VAQETGEEVRILLIDERTALRLAGAAATDSAVSVAGQTHPHTIVLDIAAEGWDPVNAIRWLLAASPRSRLIILRAQDDTAPVGELPTAALRGQQVADRSQPIRGPRAPDASAAATMSSGLTASSLQGRAVCLSLREREVLVLVARAMSNRQIASRLSITEGTVKRHLRNIFGKLGATSRIDAVNKGIAAAILSGEDRFLMPPSETG
jgi:DNA-binding NarL/FixJ family response regulator